MTPPRPCTAPGCPRTEGQCETHDRKPYTRTAKYAGGRPWQRTRARIFARDGHRCQLRIVCSGVLVTLDTGVVDHRLNRARGGSDDDGNLQAACKPCNEAKRCDEARVGRDTKKLEKSGRPSVPFRTRWQHEVI